MQDIKKHFEQHWYWYVGGALVLWFVSYLLRLLRLSKELIIQTAPTISTSGVAVKVTMKNPTGGSVSMKKPLLAFYSSEQKLADKEPFISSPSVNDNVDIPPFGEVRFSMEVPLSLTEAITARSEWGEAQKNGKIIVRVLTTINGFLPYEKIQIIKL